jgi:hypothetical protein
MLYVFRSSGNSIFNLMQAVRVLAKKPKGGSFGMVMCVCVLRNTGVSEVEDGRFGILI